MSDRAARVTAIILAAGQGKRIKSELPKVLHRAAGRPLVAHVLEAVQPLGLSQTVVVTSPRRTLFEETLTAAGWGRALTYVVQDPPAGTGDAVRIALRALDDVPGTVLVLPGDTPLLRSATLQRLIDRHFEGSASATLLTARLDDPTGYGRIVRGYGHEIEGIVEEVDATPDERAIDEVNSGVYVFDGVRLAEVIDKIDRENVQGEYYLTDVIGLMRIQGDRIVGLKTDAVEITGVNTRAQLAGVSELLREQVSQRWMGAGVTIVDPRTTYIDASVRIEREAIIHPFTFLEGNTTIGEHAEIGPQVRLIDSHIGPEAVVSFSVVRNSVVGPEASVGPYASLRPGTRLERGAHIGTFVETKQTTLGEGSKANHLAYLGDAEIGSGVNVGAGTITCNFDGREKHKTVIEDDAYIGSDTMLVAPTRIGKRAATGAGSVVRGDVPEDALAVGVPAKIIEGKGDRLGKRAESQRRAVEDAAALGGPDLDALPDAPGLAAERSPADEDPSRPD